MALNVEALPAHIGLFPEVCTIETAGVEDEFTVIVRAELITVGVLAQAELLVSKQLTTSPLFKTEVNEELLVPAFTPSTIH